MSPLTSPMIGRRRIMFLAAVISAAILVNGCTTDDSGDTSTGQAGSSEPSTATDTDQTASSDASTDAAGGTTAASSATTESNATTASTGTTTSSGTATNSEPKPDKSGCTPGEGELPDGEWFGFVESATADSLDFDLACWFTGPDADLAAAADGEESPVPNDYYIRNEATTIRTLLVEPDVPVVWYPEQGDPNSKADTTFDQWAAQRSEPFLGVWITVEGGQVAAINEQWVP